MIRVRVVAALLDLADRLGAIVDESEWYLFGSVDRNEPAASDIDLLILCTSDTQADALRQSIDPDLLPFPLDLSLMTFEEAAEADAVLLQRAHKIFPKLKGLVYNAVNWPAHNLGQ